MTRRADDEGRDRLRRIQHGVEEQIREAGERGELSGLPGEGRPLARDPDEAAGDRWAPAHVLRNAEAVPEWAELRREIQRRRARLVRLVRGHREWLRARAAHLTSLPAERILGSARVTEDADRRFQDELAAAVAETNELIARHNLVAVLALQLAPLTRERVGELASDEDRA